MTCIKHKEYCCHRSCVKLQIRNSTNHVVLYDISLRELRKTSCHLNLVLFTFRIAITLLSFACQFVHDRCINISTTQNNSLFPTKIDNLWHLSVSFSRQLPVLQQHIPTPYSYIQAYNVVWAKTAQPVELLAMCWTVWDSNSCGGKIFHTCPDWPQSQPSLLYSGYQFSCPRIKFLRHGIDHPPPSSAEGKE